MKFHLARISKQNVRLYPHVDVDVKRKMSAYLETQAQKKETKKRTQAQMAKPPSYPPPPSPPIGFPSSMTIHE